MAYITKPEYDAVFTDNDLSASDFNILADIASDIVNRLTTGKINAFGLSDFETEKPNLFARIKSATIYQVNIMAENGTLDTLTGNSDLTAQSTTIGKFSESYGSGSIAEGGNVKQIEGIPISPIINIKLQYSGLLDKALKYYEIEDFYDG